jgi:organic hydroperoxide reductase OsmC/OhrA
MSNHTARIVWNRSAATMDPKSYSRDHSWTFDSGAMIAASAAAGGPVPADTIGAGTIDPEEAVVAALSGCHMLFFLALAAKRGLTVDRYEDSPHGQLAASGGSTWLTTITLSPHVTWAGTPPAKEIVDAIHHDAHKRCYIGNSLKSQIIIEGVAAIAH